MISLMEAYILDKFVSLSVVRRNLTTYIDLAENTAPNKGWIGVLDLRVLFIFR
jgi:hypothetical protein